MVTIANLNHSYTWSEVIANPKHRDVPELVIPGGKV